MAGGGNGRDRHIHHNHHRVCELRSYYIIFISLSVSDSCAALLLLCVCQQEPTDFEMAIQFTQGCDKGTRLLNISHCRGRGGGIQVNEESIATVKDRWNFSLPIIIHGDLAIEGVGAAAAEGLFAWHSWSFQATTPLLAVRYISLDRDQFK